MPRRSLLYVLSVTLIGLVSLRPQTLPFATLQAQTPAHMPISEIRAGMVGIGHTVFTGTRVETFTANILGVIENVIGTQRGLILARLEGGPLATTGVIAGMSGSPVYVDGKLIGAVSYALGSFSKEPIAGITPIHEMLNATAAVTRPPGTRVNVEFPLSRDGLLSAFRRALAGNRPFADRADDAQVLGGSTLPGIGGREVATMLRPIAVPLTMSGFEAGLGNLIGSAFRDAGFVPMAASAGGRPGDMPFEGPLKPGDAVGITFVSGDLELGATGTVTYIDGDRVYAFGHPMYNLGPLQFPMTRAYVYTVLPSVFSSAKLSGTNEVIGTFLQDRATAIAGRLGAGPSLLPVTMTLESARGGGQRTFKFSVVRDQLFTPLMTYTALVNTLGAYERQFGTTTYAVDGSMAIGQHGSIAFANLFSGDGASSLAAAHVVAPLTALINNDYEPVDIQGLDLHIKSTEDPRTATVERVWVDDPRPRPGRTVPVKVLLRTYRGEDVLQTVPIEIPSNARGNLTVMVSDATRLAQSESREARLPQPRSVNQLVRALNKTRRNNHLYVKLLGAEPGAVVNGEVLPALPPSVLAVLEADRSTGSFSPVNSTTLGEWTVATEHAINGARMLTLQLSSN